MLTVSSSNHFIQQLVPVLKCELRHASHRMFLLSIFECSSQSFCWLHWLLCCTNRWRKVTLIWFKYSDSYKNTMPLLLQGGHLRGLCSYVTQHQHCLLNCFITYHTAVCLNICTTLITWPCTWPNHRLTLYGTVIQCHTKM